ncbi:hypothetical protein J6590_079822 [Homalodisca vitripennis]|nr:hypothetical protein J6590_079822 [Homalodisca vitripennis]
MSPQGIFFTDVQDYEEVRLNSPFLIRMYVGWISITIRIHPSTGTPFEGLRGCRITDSPLASVFPVRKNLRVVEGLVPFKEPISPEDS